MFAGVDGSGVLWKRNRQSPGVTSHYGYLPELIPSPKKSGDHELFSVWKPI
jgi:hypothetical protein